MRSFLKKPLFWIPFALIVLAVGGYFYFSSGSKETKSFTEAKRGNIVQEVSVTGKIKPAESVDLAFEKTGKITSVGAAVGENVYAGQILVRLDYSELSAQLSKSEADLSAQEAKLQESKVSLANYYSDVVDVVNSAYTTSNDSVRKQIDELFSDDEHNPQLTFTTTNSQLETDIEFQRVSAIKILNDWVLELRSVKTDSSRENLDKATANAKSNLLFVNNLLDLATEAIINSINIAQSTLTTYRSNINTAKTNINSSLADINKQAQNINTQNAAIAAEEATIESYKAAIENIKAQIAKTVIVSPINGVITKQEAKVGEIASPNSAIVSIISVSEFDIEANVPEADIGKISIGDKSRITLDAYGSDVVFEARVVSVDPAETVIEGIPTYKTVLNFLDKDERIKPGMTANIDILTAERNNVVVIPQRAVVTKNGDKFVLVYNGTENPEERKIEIGVKGSDGNVEVTSGISEGEQVITSAGE
ncbi:MAG: efflux RND transporter periplasmic adaptor subunit [Patescibacteria group bacterium]